MAESGAKKPNEKRWPIYEIDTEMIKVQQEKKLKTTPFMSSVHAFYGADGWKKALLYASSAYGAKNNKELTKHFQSVFKLLRLNVK